MLEDIINDDTPLYDNSSWKIKKREQLKNAYSIIESAVEEIKKSPQFLQTYLDVQSRFDRYTVRNALLLAKQYPEARQLKDYNSWKELNVYFKTKYPNKVVILEPGQAYINKDGKKVTPYNAKEMIDISETDLKPIIKNYDKKLVLQALIHRCPVKIEPVDNLENGQMCSWNKELNTIYVCKTNDYNIAISCIAKEVAKANLYDERGELSDEKAKCIGYMICKKYDVEVSIDNNEQLVAKFSTKDNKEIKEELSAMKNVLDNINNRMEQYLDEKVRKSKDKKKER